MRGSYTRACCVAVVLLGGSGACASGEGDSVLDMFESPTPNGDWTLSDGYYVFENGGLGPNECGYVEDSGSFDEYAGADVVSTATELQVEIEGTLLVYEVDGLDLYDPNSPGSADFDFNDPQVASDSGLSQTYDCVVTQTIEYTGSITGVDRFRLEDSLDFTGNGSECQDFAAEFGFAEFPCVTVDGADAVLDS